MTIAGNGSAINANTQPQTRIETFTSDQDYIYYKNLRDFPPSRGWIVKLIEMKRKNGIVTGTVTLIWID